MSQKLFRALAIGVVLFLSSMCYLYGVLHEVPESTYTGIRSINASDYNQHLTWIGQAREGHLLQKNLFTSESQSGLLIRPVYFLLSVPFAWTSLSNTVVLHILRVLCGIILLLTLFSLFRAYGLDQRKVWLAFLLITLTSGLGFLFRSWMHDPADLGVPEAILFLSLGEAPHFLFSLLFLWVGVTAFYRRTEDSTRTLWPYFAALALLWFEHPFDAVILICVCTVNLWQVDSRARLSFLIGTVVLSVPAYLYYQFLKSQPAFAGWGSSQNLMLSPPILSLLVAFIPLLVMGIPGGLRMYRNENQRRLFYFMLLWAGAQLILSYVPFPFQRRLIAGVQFPLVILAVYGLDRIKSRVIVAGIILVCSSGSAVVMQEQIRDISGGGMPYYLPHTYRSAFQWLSGRERKGAVLSGFVTGNFIPAYTGFQSYCGHSSLTPEVDEKRRLVQDFYMKPNSAGLKDRNIQYVFWGAEEKHLSGANPPPFMQPVYSSGGIFIFRAGDKSL